MAHPYFHTNDPGLGCLAPALQMSVIPLKFTGLKKQGKGTWIYFNT